MVVKRGGGEGEGKTEATRGNRHSREERFLALSLPDAADVWQLRGHLISAVPYF